ncbi:MAG TPA: hypothetical protein VMU66_00260 [Gaiellales bacterium]|nr:hypothetical protein [Gaiellales bacterium]
MLRRRSAAFVLCACLCGITSTSASAAAPGAVTHQSGWRTAAAPEPGVLVQRETISVAGYPGARTVTRISWTIGDSRVWLDASPTVASAYRPADQSFGEGLISRFGASVHALAGINGGTFCEWCGTTYGDTLHGLLVHRRRIYALAAGPVRRSATPRAAA